MIFRICSFLVFTFGAVLTPSFASGQQLPFRDDFNDGDAMDGLPGTWLPAASPGGTRDASSGDLVATIADRNGMSTSVEELTGLRDMSIRAQLRFTEVSGNGDIASLWGRSPSNDDPAAYGGGIGTDGSLFISYFDGQNANVLRSLQTTLNPVSADVLLQFDIVGDQLSLTAWQDDEDQPAAPQLITRDNHLTDGGLVGFSLEPNFFGGNKSASVALRHFEVVPEPASSTLSAFALMLMFAYRWSRLSKSQH